MKKYMHALSLALVLTLCVAGPALAQESTPAYCSELGAEACELLDASHAAMQNITSGVTEIEFTLLFNEIPEAPLSEIGVGYFQRSLFSYDADVASLIAEMQEMTAQERQLMLSDPDELASVVMDLVQGIATDVQLTVILSQEVADRISQEAGMTIPQEIDFSFVLLDGILYFNLEALVDIIPELALLGGWVGIDLTPLLEMSLQDVATTELSEQDLQAIGNGFASVNFGSSGPLVASIHASDPTGLVSEFMRIERLEDDAINGNDVAVFRTTVDPVAFFSSPLYRNLLVALMSDETISGGLPVDQAGVDQIVSLSQVFGPMVMQSMNLELLEGIGLDDGYLYGSNFVLEWDLANLASLASMAGGAIEIDPEAEPFIGIELLTLNDDLNEEITISVPPGAIVLPIEALMSLAEL